jgi:hypothetical protein
MKIIFAFIVLTAGCAGYGFDGPVEMKPGQDQAEEIAWHSTFGSEGVTGVRLRPPPVVWRHDDVCGGAPGAWLRNGHCLEGRYDADEDFAEVEWLGSISRSAYAHELAHAFLQYRTGDADKHHVSRFFVGDDGNQETAGSFVGDANEALRRAGL